MRCACRKGNKYIRTALCEAAHAATKAKGTTLQSKFEAKSSIGRKKAVFLIAHKIARIGYTILKKNELYQEQHINYMKEVIERKTKNCVKKSETYGSDYDVVVRNKRTGEIMKSREDVQLSLLS